MMSLGDQPRAANPVAQDAHALASVCELFPQRNHCIATSAGTDNSQKVTFVNREIYIMKRGRLALYCMVGIAHVVDFH